MSALGKFRTAQYNVIALKPERKMGFPNLKKQTILNT